MAEIIYNLSSSTWKAEAGELPQVQGQYRLSIKYQDYQDYIVSPVSETQLSKLLDVL